MYSMNLSSSNSLMAQVMDKSKIRQLLWKSVAIQIPILKTEARQNYKEM